MLIQESVAAATAVVGYDLLTNRKAYQTTPYFRRVTRVGLRGSAAAGDTAVALKVGNTEVARFYNDATGFPGREAMLEVQVNVPANSPLIAEVIDAPATNPINIAIETQP